MKTNTSTWIEGNGTLRTVFRTLALWAYSSEEKARLQLVKAMESRDNHPGIYTLQYAIHLRKKEIQWIAVNIPLFYFLVLCVLLMAGGLASHDPRNLSVSVFLVLYSAVVFRTTFFNLYLDACRFLYKAADKLWKERLENGVAEKVEFPARPMNSPEILPPADRLESILSDKPEKEPAEDSELSPGKGAISIFLLDELVKKECDRPNIHGGDIHKTTAYYAYISGCRPKNIQGKAKQYLNRASLNLSTPNSRSTHRKYLEILLEHYCTRRYKILKNAHCTICDQFQRLLLQRCTDLRVIITRVF
jgi:hypothetical protein